LTQLWNIAQERSQSLESGINSISRLSHFHPGRFGQVCVSIARLEGERLR
jgi:hypothetical protein